MGNKEDISNVTVIGAGTMGRGIAHVAALGGFNTVLNDVSDDFLITAQNQIRKDLMKAIEIGKLTSDQMDASLTRLKLETKMEYAAETADLVIEAVPEQIDLKLALFARLDQVCTPQAIFASNTSALSITEMAGATRRPQRFIGTHFFNPVHKMKLVEIVRGLETSEDTFAIAETGCKRMGKDTVEVKESPGFVTSRINALIGNEAFYMLQENIASARDIFLQHVEGFIANERVNPRCYETRRLFYFNSIFPHSFAPRFRYGECIFARLQPPDNLDQFHFVDGVEKVRPNEPLGPPCCARHLCDA